MLAAHILIEKNKLYQNRTPTEKKFLLDLSIVASVKSLREH